MENMKKASFITENSKASYRKLNLKPPVSRRPDVYLESCKNFKKPRPSIGKPDGGPFVECEESLSKLQEISFTKYIHQNLNTKPNARNEILEGRWNGPLNEKLKTPGKSVVIILCKK